VRVRATLCLETIGCFRYWRAGFETVMVTDTAFYRNPRYHSAADTPDTLDCARMAWVSTASTQPCGPWRASDGCRGLRLAGGHRVGSAHPPTENRPMSKKTVVDLLNRIMEMELAGVVRYTHYSLMVYGYNRIPIVSWLRGEATTSMAHATEAGELVTQLGAHPSLGIGPLLETHEHEIGAILRESLAHEAASLALYKQLLAEVEGESVMLEEYARDMIAEEERHLGEVDKMLRNPGEIGTFAAREGAAKPGQRGKK
jgi:bacterioferritin